MEILIEVKRIWYEKDTKPNEKFIGEESDVPVKTEPVTVTGTIKAVNDFFENVFRKVNAE